MPLHERHNALNQDVMMVPVTPVDPLQEVNDLNFDLVQHVPFDDEVDDEFDLQQYQFDVGMHDDEEPTLIVKAIKLLLLVMLASAVIIVTFQIKL